MLELVADGDVLADKIGVTTFYWSFPSEAVNKVTAFYWENCFHDEVSLMLMLGSGIRVIRTRGRECLS